MSGAIKLSEACQNEIIDFLAPMEPENDSFKITDMYQLFVNVDTTIYRADEFNSVFFIGIIFNNDTSNFNIIACYPELYQIYFTYLINEKSDLLISNGSSFWHNFKQIKNNDCIEIHDTIEFGELPEDEIRYMAMAGNSTINGQWIPDTIKQEPFMDSDLNNTWSIQGDLDIKNLRIFDSNSNLIFSDTCDFERNDFILKNKEKEFLILCIAPKAVFFYDRENELIHRLNRKK